MGYSSKKYRHKLLQSIGIGIVDTFIRKYQYQYWRQYLQVSLTSLSKIFLGICRLYCESENGVFVQVACKFRKFGCMHVGQLSYLGSHTRSCTFNPENLPDFLRTDVERDSLQSVHNTSQTGNSSSSLHLVAGKVKIYTLTMEPAKASQQHCHRCTALTKWEFSLQLQWLLSPQTAGLPPKCRALLCGFVEIPGDKVFGVHKYFN